MELNKARDNKANFDARSHSSRSELYQALNKKQLLGSEALNIHLSIQKIRIEYKLRLNAKLKKLSVRQNRPIKEQNFDSNRILDDISLPSFVKNLLSYGPKYPIPDNFNKVHFLADINKLVCGLRKSGTDCEKLCEIEASAKCYAKNVRKTHADRGVVKVATFSKDNNIVAATKFLYAQCCLCREVVITI